MIKKINLANPLQQFYIILTASLLLYGCLYLYPTSNYNLHPPEGAHSGNILRGSDVGSYLYPARNFIEFGIFGKDETPGYLRTIGYSTYEVVLITIFGEYFFWVAYFIQAVMAASIFYVITLIINFFVKNDQRITKTVFIFLALSGAYWTYFYLLATDLFFAFFFITGLYYAIKAISLKSWKYGIAHLLLIGYAANVRPTLILYAIPEFFILLSLAYYFKTIVYNKTKMMIGTLTVLVFVLTNIPSLRNYINYGVMKPSNVFEINLHQFLARETLIMANREEDYDQQAAIALAKEKVNWGDACAYKKQVAFETIKKYPKEAAIVLAKHLFKNLGTPHYLRGTLVLLFKFKQPKDAAEITLDGTINTFSDLVKAVGVPILLLSVVFVCIYPLLWLFCIKHFFRMFKQKQYLYCVTLLLFFGYLITPTLPCANGARSRLASEWLIVILAVTELYYSWDRYKRSHSMQQKVAVEMV